MSRLRRPFLSDRYFFVTVPLLNARARLLDADFHLMVLALSRVRRQHPFYLTAWVFLPDLVPQRSPCYVAGFAYGTALPPESHAQAAPMYRGATTWHAICAPVYPLTVSRVMKSFKNSSTILINRRRAGRGELWQARFFDRALQTVEEYNEKLNTST